MELTDITQDIVLGSIHHLHQYILFIILRIMLFIYLLLTGQIVLWNGPGFGSLGFKEDKCKIFHLGGSKT